MANPSSSTTPTLGLDLLYEGVKVDNDIFMMFEKLVGTTTVSLYGQSTARTANYATTDFDFMVIKVIGSTSVDSYATNKGAGMVGNIPEIKIPKPTTSMTYDLPRFYKSEADGSVSSGTFTFTTTNVTVPAVSSGATYRYVGMMVIEFYKYATS